MSAEMVAAKAEAKRLADRIRGVCDQMGLGLPALVEMAIENKLAEAHIDGQMYECRRHQQELIDELGEAS